MRRLCHHMEAVYDRDFARLGASIQHLAENLDLLKTAKAGNPTVDMAGRMSVLISYPDLFWLHGGVGEKVARIIESSLGGDGAAQLSDRPAWRKGPSQRELYNALLLNSARSMTSLLTILGGDNFGGVSEDVIEF